MSVIVGRALPDVRDGLKPVHRRILWSMLEAGPAARPPVPQVGRRRRRRDEEVPPARRPRDLRRVGSDGAGLLAARTRSSTVTATSGRSTATRRPPTRYTEARLAPMAHGAAPRHRGRDGRLRPELRRLRAAAGRAARRASRTCSSTGRAASRSGMATNIPPHNLGEVIDAVVHFLDHPESTSEGPDEVRQGTGLPDRRDRSWAARASGTPTRPAGARSRSAPCHAIEEGAERPRSGSWSPSCRTR